MRRSLPLLVVAAALALGCGGGASDPDLSELAALTTPSASYELDKAIELEDAGQHEAALTTIDGALTLGQLQGAELAEAHTIRGNILNELDRFEEAVDAHKASLAIDPDQANVWTNLGVVYRLQGDYEGAQECYEKAMALDPTYPELYASLGSVLLYQGQITQALETLDKGIVLGADIPIMHSNRSVALAYAGRFEEARASLQKGVDLGYPNGESVGGIIDEIEAGGDPMGIRSE